MDSAIVIDFSEPKSIVANVPSICPQKSNVAASAVNKIYSSAVNKVSREISLTIDIICIYVKISTPSN